MWLIAATAGRYHFLGEAHAHDFVAADGHADGLRNAGATTLDGSLIFTATGEASGASTTGDLEATIDSQAYSGTWRAYDVGSYAVWAGRAQGDTNSLSVIGWSTPERVIGSATIGSGKGLGAILALLFNRGYYFYGEAALSEPPPTAAAAN